jgi:hypothetical protein
MRAKHLKVVIPVAIVALLAVFALVGALVRSGDQAANLSATTASDAGRDGAMAGGVAPEPATAESLDAAKAADEAGASGTGGDLLYADVPPSSAASAHYLIRNGSITLTVARHGLRDAMGRINTITLGMGGYVLSSYIGSETAWYGGIEPMAYDASGAATGMTYDDASKMTRPEDANGTSDVVQYGTVTVRVPEERFDDAVERFSKLGEVVDMTTSAEDVSDQMVDLRARLRHQRAVEERLLGFLDQARTIKETLAVQDRIDQTQLTIEQLSAEIARLGEVTSYGTLTVSLRERGVPQPGAIDQSDSFWGAFTNSLGLIADGAKASAVALGALLPFLALVGAIGAAVWYGRRAVLRRRPPRAPQAPQTPQTPAVQS